MEEKQNVGYYSIIPSTILYNKNLKANEKILYAVITSLSNKEGYCFASNKYFAELYHVTIFSREIRYWSQYSFWLDNRFTKQARHLYIHKCFYGKIPIPFWKNIIREKIKRYREK